MKVRDTRSIIACCQKAGTASTKARSGSGYTVTVVAVVVARQPFARDTRSWAGNN